MSKQEIEKKIENLSFRAFCLECKNRQNWRDRELLREWYAEIRELEKALEG